MWGDHKQKILETLRWFPALDSLAPTCWCCGLISSQGQWQPTFCRLSFLAGKWIEEQRRFWMNRGSEKQCQLTNQQDKVSYGWLRWPTINGVNTRTVIWMPFDLWRHKHVWSGPVTRIMICIVIESVAQVVRCKCNTHSIHERKSANNSCLVFPSRFAFIHNLFLMGPGMQSVTVHVKK